MSCYREMTLVQEPTISSRPRWRRWLCKIGWHEWSEQPNTLKQYHFKKRVSYMFNYWVKTNVVCEEDWTDCCPCGRTVARNWHWWFGGPRRVSRG